MTKCSPDLSNKKVRIAYDDRFLVFTIDQVPPISNTKHPAGATMLGVVASDLENDSATLLPNGYEEGEKAVSGGHHGDTGQVLALGQFPY